MKSRLIKPAENFDRIARSYETMERLAFGSLLQKARTAHLEKVEHAEQVLLVGEGNGRFLAALLEKNRRCQVTCIDQSRRMLDLAENRVQLRDRKRVRFALNDFEKEPMSLPEFDVVVTHFFLDCFAPETLNRMLPRLSDSLSPGGTWLMADFVEPSDSGTIASLQRTVLRALYYFFAKTGGIKANKISCPEKKLEALGMKENGRSSYLRGWITSSIYHKSPCRNPDRFARITIE